MPSATDYAQFFRGQLCQTPTLPETSFAGKTVVITGANQGLGYDSARQLIDLNVSTLVLGCRDLSKGEAAKQKILSKGDVKTKIEVWEVNMSSYASVQAFAARVNQLPRLDVLLVNAGMSTNKFHLAEELEETLTVNVVATFLLSLLVLPRLQESARQNGVPSHLAITGSAVHAFAPDDQLRTPATGQIFATLSEQSKANMATRYYLSKLIVLQCLQEMAKTVRHQEKFGGPSVIVNFPAPGWCKTELFRTDDGGVVGRNLLKRIGRTSEEGARTLTSAIAAGSETHGHYLSECQVKPASIFVRSEQGQQVQVKVWKELLDILEKVSPGVTKIVR
ncbi:uncharacterized protein MYCGRDRAFT_49497 [Zymoseptoria tritici IPO323]|uniref:Short-chain dehydrogenase/reductase n=1 Tax=Zymoseptoria tritici (strain CBS 115943 / IPO323) TaxID=336722 RepID=F9XM23_ZYMTI|nr:uncharacterized protein MYCGRDRAFT_49497 [Zymoseptoria tritici IPO323]EGP83524.1 hypothetical protein MYCGRDRAFT_49497 [Zymoseptoria tritici IPO323]